MESGERLDALESDMGQITVQLMALNNAVQTLVTGQNPTSDTTHSTMDTSSETDRTMGGRTKIKPAPPSDFDGNRGKGRAFLNSCELYLRLSPNRFPDELSKIYLALTYMKTDRAYMFANRILRYESIIKKPRFNTWVEFWTEFIKDFFPKNETQRAVTRLETPAYFQGKGSVDDYIDKFKDLIDLSGYTDGLAIVVKFRRGLDPDIQNYVANMMEGRPDDDDIEGWYSAASRCDENRAANAAFHSSSRPLLSTRIPVSRPPMPPARQVTTPQVPSSTQVSSLPAPMDVDATKRGAVHTMTCYRCSKTGHLSKNCPRAFDVRFMTEDERADWVQQLLVSEDLKEVEVRELETEEKDEAKEDFAPSNE